MSGIGEDIYILMNAWVSHFAFSSRTAVRSPAPVGLCHGTGVLDPPIPSMWGDWYLQFPIIGPVNLGAITSPDGLLIVPTTISNTHPVPYTYYLQALIGAELTNLSVLEIK